MGDTSFNKLMNVDSMPSKSRLFLLYSALFFALTSHAAQDGKDKVSEDLTAPVIPRKFTATQSHQFEIDKRGNQVERFNESEDYQRNNRYGIGYEMRHGGQTSAHGNRARGR